MSSRKDEEHDRRRNAVAAMNDTGTDDPDTTFANSIVDDWIREACPECHGTGFADENRPCEHPGRSS